MAMEFIIDNAIFEKYPDYLCGFIAAKKVDNAGMSEEVISAIKTVQEKVRTEMSLKNLSENPFIRNWRNVYSSFGAQPSRYKASSEALIRRTLRGEAVPHVNKLVDIYNYISLKYKTPVGGEDISKINDPVWLRFAKGTEKFTKLGQMEDDPIDIGEVVYVDNKDNVLCRRWNWRESEITKLTEQTKDAMLVIEALPPLTEEAVRGASTELSDLVEKFCGGSTEASLLSKRNRKIVF